MRARAPAGTHAAGSDWGTAGANLIEQWFVMRGLLPPLLACAIGLSVLPADAQQPRQPTVAAAGTVTILTDGLADANSRATQAINELAELPKGIGNIRVLPIAGHGAVENVRDLLYLRGVDLAILNSDVLKFLERTRQLPHAADRVRYVTHLFDQTVYLLVRKDLAAIEDLRGRKVLVLSKGGASHTTATTLFGLLKIDVVLETPGSSAHLEDESVEKSDGVLLLGGELARARLSARARQGLRVLPIAMTPALAGAYRPAVVEPQDVPGVPQADKVETVAVSTLLAVFNWTSSHGRLANVSRFVKGLLAALPGLREQNPGSVWRQADISAQLPGWSRHAAALPERWLGKAQIAELAAVERPRAALPPAAPEPSSAVAAHPAAVRVLAFGRAPFADEQMPDGGLIPALVGRSLGMTELGGGVGSPIEMRWAKEVPPIKVLLGDPSIDISLPWEGADCDRPNDLVQTSAVLCDQALFSDPILQVVVGLFTLSDSDFKFASDESIFGRTICLTSSQDASALNGSGRNWLTEKRVTAVRQPTLLDCVSAVQRREADAFIANDLEARHLLDRLGLAGHFRMAERPLAIGSVRAIVSKAHPQAPHLLVALNSGLKRLKESDAYGAIVRSHLTRLWGSRTSMP
jgi:hypothetical protein